jgi:hypothetical protein
MLYICSLVVVSGQTRSCDELVVSSNSTDTFFVVPPLFLSLYIYRLHT